MLPPVWYEIDDDGIQLLELASEAHQLFLEQKPEEKRRLLGFLVATASWKDGELSASLRPPFDLIREGVASAAAQTAAAIDGERSRTDRAPALSNSHQRRFSNSKAAVAIHSQGKMANWLPLVDALRTILLTPPPEVRETIVDLRLI
jgi:hypothetical protein